MQMMGSPGTTGLYLLSMWYATPVNLPTHALSDRRLRDDDNNAAPKPWVSSFLGEDRLPYKEGFVKPEKLKTGERLSDMTKAVAAVPV